MQRFLQAKLRHEWAARRKEHAHKGHILRSVKRSPQTSKWHQHNYNKIWTDTYGPIHNVNSKWCTYLHGGKMESWTYEDANSFDQVSCFLLCIHYTKPSLLFLIKLIILNKINQMAEFHIQLDRHWWQFDKQFFDNLTASLPNLSPTPNACHPRILIPEVSISKTCGSGQGETLHYSSTSQCTDSTHWRVPTYKEGVV